MTRIMKLGRQLREIEQAIFALPAPLERQVASITSRELDLAARCDPPWMYGTPPEQETAAWGTGADIGITRVRSDNPQVRMRGIGLWLAVIYHETQTSDAPGASELHRQVMRVVRQLKERLGDSDAAAIQANADEADAAESSTASAAVA
ncbi:hypothetical protein [Oleiagrimonas soli]|uniref:Uncharacterized protein n=1 Tax=Oleiagrimonas soli TaxID=1543381 RepID=A0A099CWA5_9GAMM|nr:hypothetical protein [Oleiagrimonas soli]KGI77315.1 hypothetical protein LF63_0110535 [Oleiagrimonas soli]MBB6182775.1 hypothetical protein [Oleiagrimonas soli]